METNFILIKTVTTQRQRAERDIMIRKFDFEDWEEPLKTKIIISSFEPEKDFKRQILERMFALLDHYHIDRKDPNKWFYLSNAMAREFIPCFELGDAFDGSKPFSEEGLLFYADIREIIKNSPEKIDVKEALTQYSYLFPLKDEPNIESLNTKYYRILGNNRMIKYHFQEAEKFYADKDVENKEELIQEYVDNTIIELAKNLRAKQNEEPKHKEKKKMERVKFVAIPNL